MSSAKHAVLFVCLGNICRSPTAHGVFETLLEQSSLAGQVHVDSAGTAAYHVGNPPDSRSIAKAKSLGYELSHLRARKVSQQDFHDFDLILAMDQENLENLMAIRPTGSKARVQLFLDFIPEQSYREVPDPYYGGDQGFQLVINLVESASQGLLEHLDAQLRAE